MNQVDYKATKITRKVLSHVDGEIKFFSKVLKEDSENKVARGHLLANEFLRNTMKD